MDVARLENMICEVNGGREKVIQQDDRVKLVGWIVKGSPRYTWAGNT